ncbi:MAG: S8 family serine peptidase [bacterium]|nr:S8 family serine peptidase [bacterium]
MHIFKIILTLSIITNCIAQVHMDEELTSIMQADTQRDIPVIIVFKQIKSSVAIQNTNFSVQERKVRSTRRAQAAFLADTAKLGLFKNRSMKSMWINNSIIMTLKGSEISALINRDDIESILLDRTVYLNEPVVSEDNEIDEEEVFTYGLIRMGIPELRKKYDITGKGVTVGLLDSGWAEHPDLGDRVKRSRDFVSNKPDNKPNDGHGHGTHCLGTIGGAATSGKSIGVAPDVEFIVGKIYRDDASTEVSKQLEAMQWMADPDGNPDTDDHPRLVSNSWGWKLKEMPDASAFQRAVQTWRELGIVPVFSAGNSGPWRETIGYPGGFPETIAVGATDSDDAIATFSSRGPVLRGGTLLRKPDVSAPGVDVYSGDLKGGYVKMSGTSMSAPHVAGVIALIFQAFPDLSVAAVEDILKSSAVDLGEKGFDYKFGDGRVNALAALEQTLNSGRLVIDNQSSAQGKLTVKIEPGNRHFELANGKNLDRALPQGSYIINIDKFGYKPIVKEINLTALKTTKVSFELEALPASKIHINTPGSENESWVIVHDTPFEILTTSQGKLSQSLPHGQYKISVVRRGYLSQTFEVDFNSDLALEVKLDKAATCLLVNDDPNSDFADYYSAALKANQISHHSESSRASNLAQMLSYERVIWFTGDSEETVLDSSEQNSITSYLKYGGQLLLSGHGIGNDLRDSNFFYEVLGARYKYQRRLFRNIKFEESGLKLKLNGSDSADNQSKPDVLKPFGKNSQSIVQYSFLGSAGILNTFGTGKVAYLGFGLEGIRGADNRAAALQNLFNLLRLTSDEKLKVLQDVHKVDSNLHNILSVAFAKGTQAEKQVLSEKISKTSEKKAFRKLMFELKHRN